jgi:hypothetical protein
MRGPQPSAERCMCGSEGAGGRTVGGSEAAPMKMRTR